MPFSGANLAAQLLLGSIGFVSFAYGKKNARVEANVDRNWPDDRSLFHRGYGCALDSWVGWRLGTDLVSRIGGSIARLPPEWT